jgi:BolA-like protein 1
MSQQASDLPGNLRTIVGAFQMVPDPMARYKQLLFFASKLEGLDDSLKIEENKVQARCHSLSAFGKSKIPSH